MYRFICLSFHQARGNNRDNERLPWLAQGHVCYEASRVLGLPEVVECKNSETWQ